MSQIIYLRHENRKPLLFYIETFVVFKKSLIVLILSMLSTSETKLEHFLCTLKLLTERSLGQTSL